MGVAMILPITLSAAGAAALINLWLAIRVGRVRTSEKVLMGDGGNEGVIAAMRAHANFVEYTPFIRQAPVPGCGSLAASICSGGLRMR
jgi:uncharacterized membrane protein YecN with MAPEG domain